MVLTKFLKLNDAIVKDMDGLKGRQASLWINGWTNQVM